MRVGDFDKLPIPYRAVATDMVSGRMVVLDRGDLATAMRASMAIPGAFAPVIWDKYILADGGQVRNIPVDVARETCADVVIVVNLVEPPTPREKLVQAQQLLARSMEVMLEANENLSLASLGPNDIRIDVPMGDISYRGLHAGPGDDPAGRSGRTQDHRSAGRYAVPEAEYVAWRNRVTTPQDIETRLAGVRFEGLQYVNPEFLPLANDDQGRRQRRHRGDQLPMRRVCRPSRTSTPCRTGWRATRRSPTLVWMPVEASVGPNVLRPAMGIYASNSGDLKFLLGRSTSAIG